MSMMSAIRRTTITTDNLAESLRFWQDGLGMSTWYEGRIDDPVMTRLLGVQEGTVVNMVILKSSGPNDADSEFGMIGLMEIVGERIPKKPESPTRLPLLGETVTLFETHRIGELCKRLRNMGFADIGDPVKIAVPDRDCVYEMAVRDPNGARITFVQFQEP